MDINTNGAAAWITTDPGVVLSGNVELDIITSDGHTGVSHATDVPITADDYSPAIDQADSVIREAGYRRTTDWTATNNGFVAAITSDSRNQQIIEMLDNYNNLNVWEEIIYRLPEFDGEATDNLYEIATCDIGQKDTFVANNVVFEFEQDNYGWTCRDMVDYRY